jgi:hypothetical protein
MMRGSTQFVGLAGEYYLAYALTVRRFHAALTRGNVPHVDILVSTPIGSRQLALQVKTARNAFRSGRFGHALWEWDVGPSAIGRSSTNLWYAFVDLREDSTHWNPEVFFVPSLWVASWVKASHSRKRYYLREELADRCRERWDLVRHFLAGSRKAYDWARALPRLAYRPA